MDAEHPYRMAALGACLALVRPVGMAENETIDWLEVASDTLSHIPIAILEKGARAARGKCTHHSQIVPTIITETQEALAWHNRPGTWSTLRLVLPAPTTEAEPVPDLPLPDPNTLMPNLRRMGLSKGWIVERDGMLAWAEDAA